MKRLQLRWTTRALRRLEQLGEAIARDNPAAAGRVIMRIERAVIGLADQPEKGRSGRVAGTRELVFADIPYIVAYRITPATIDVLTILHAAQRWPERL